MSNVSILLVDDEPRNLDALEAILGNEGYQLLRAEDADSALRLLLNNDVAAILLDIQMPRMNGIELAHIIKRTKRFRELPIVFLTAHMVDDRDVITGYGAGAVDYLTKPFNPQILKHKVAVFAELFRKTRALAELNETLEQRVQQRTAELEKSEAALRAAAKQKDEFLAVLAHELRNPLAPLRTGLDLLAKTQRNTMTAAVARTFGAMNRQLDHIVRLIDDLLDVSRINSGVLELKKEETDLAAVATAAVEAFRAVFETKKVNLHLRARSAPHALVDSTRILQVIGNLLHNASKFTPPNGNVEVEITHEGATAIVQVKDSGAGIPHDQLGRVFEMFTRIERRGAGGATTVDRGAGIGLALAKRLAEMHGGTLSVESAGEGCGSTFTLTLPALALAVKVEAGPVEVRAAGGPLRIVVIEDSEDIADTLADWLESEGHSVQVARTGEEGLELVLGVQPDVVLCDVGLPRMDGVEVCERVRAHGGDAQPVMVALTGWGQQQDRERTRVAGFDHHLVKPVGVDELSDVLSRVEGKRHAPRSEDDAGAGEVTPSAR
jgi:signal transduction histidine kinase